MKFKEARRYVCLTCANEFSRVRRRGSESECSRCVGSRRVSAWKAANPERARLINRQPSNDAKRRYAQSERGQEVGRARSRRWAASHRAYGRAKCMERHAQKLKALPKWADKRAINLLYGWSRVMQLFTGCAYHVDHIVPLRSPHVSGLHVEHNLRVIPAQENRRKSNRLLENA